MAPQKIPAITTDQMIEVDRLMVEVYGIDLIQMMENAGRNLAALSRDRFAELSREMGLEVGPIFAIEEVIQL